MLGLRGRSLTFRVTATVVALVVGACVLLTLISTSVVARHLTERLDDDVLGAQSRAVRALERPFGGGLGSFPSSPEPPDVRGAGGQEVGTVTAHLVRDDDDISGQARVVDEDGQGEELDARVIEALGDLDVKPGTVGTVDLPGLGQHRVVRSVFALTDSDAEVVVVSALPTASVDATIATLVRWSTLLGAGAAALAGLVAALVARRQLRPLREVAQTAHTVTATDLTSGEVDVPRVPAHLLAAGTEVGQVAQALDAVLGHVDEALEVRHRSEQQVRQFVADASHELRTPLATVRGYTDLALRFEADGELRVRSLEKVRTEAERMGGLVEDLLLLARLDQGRPLGSSEVDLTMLVLESVTDAQVTSPEHRWAMTLPDEPVTVTGDAARLHQVLTNLLSNASRHTPEGTRVETAVTRGASTVELTVTDDGPGIAPALLGEVFTRFTRGDSARTRAASGAGLGLSLARSIAQAHGGELDVESRPGRTCFRLTLPV